MPDLARLFSWCVYLPLLLLAAASGCQRPAPPPAVSSFQASVEGGIFSHDLKLLNQNPQELQSVDATLTIYCERETHQVTRHWSYWQPDETKTISFPATGGPWQRVVLAGPAFLGPDRRPVRLEVEWLWKHEPQ